MQIVIDSKPVAALTPQQQRHILLTGSQPETSGLVLSPEDAIKRIEPGQPVLTAALAIIPGLLLGSLMIGLFRSGHSLHRMQHVIIIVAGAVLLAALLSCLRSWLQRRRWRRSLAARLSSLPQPGTPLRTDDISLIIGPQAFAWSDLTITELILHHAGELGQDRYRIDRLVLDAAGHPVAFDTPMIENGRCLIDQIYHRLAPPA